MRFKDLRRWGVVLILLLTAFFTAGAEGFSSYIVYVEEGLPNYNRDELYSTGTATFSGREALAGAIAACNAEPVYGANSTIYIKDSSEYDVDSPLLAGRFKLNIIAQEGAVPTINLIAAGPVSQIGAVVANSGYSFKGSMRFKYKDYKFGLNENEKEVLLTAPGITENGSSSFSDILAQTQALIQDSPETPGDITVYIRGGNYYFDETINITYSISGSTDSEVRFAAYPGENVRFIGGRKIEFADFYDLEGSGDSFITKVPSASRPYIKVLDLAALGITDYGDMMGLYQDKPDDEFNFPLDLYINDQRMYLSRWPNKRVNDIHNQDKTQTYHFAKIDNYGDHAFNIHSDSKRPSDKGWEAISNDNNTMWIHGYPTDYSDDMAMPINSIDHKSDKDVFHSNYQADGHFKSEYFVYFFNIPQEMDYPGEWYLDHNTKKLYLYPPEGFNSASDMYITQTQNLLEISQTKDITFENIIFEGSKNTLIDIIDSHSVTFNNCVIKNSGGRGVYIRTSQNTNGIRDLPGNDPYNTVNSSSCVIKNSEIYETGAHAVEINGGNRSWLKPSYHMIDNNRIHNYSMKWRERSAISLRGVGNRVFNNTIYYGPSGAIRFRGNDHLIHHNFIYRVCQEKADFGAIYVGRDWGTWGNEVHDNLLYHIKNKLAAAGYYPPDPDQEQSISGIYLDDLASGVSVQRNLLHDIQLAGIFIGGGRNNKIINNIIYEASYNYHIDQRGIFSVNGGEPADLSSYVDDLSQFQHREDPWASAYPVLVEHDPTTDLNGVSPRNNGHYAYGNVLEKNISFVMSNGSHNVGIGGEHVDSIWEHDNTWEKNPYLEDPDELNYTFQSPYPPYNWWDSTSRPYPNGWVDIPLSGRRGYFGHIPESPDLVLAQDITENLTDGINRTFHFAGAIAPWGVIKKVEVVSLDELNGQESIYEVTSPVQVNPNGSISGTVTIPSTFVVYDFLFLKISLAQTDLAKWALGDKSAYSNRIFFIPTE